MLKMTKKQNHDTKSKLEDVYAELIKLYDYETDPERYQWYEYLLDTVQEAIDKLQKYEKTN